MVEDLRRWHVLKGKFLGQEFLSVPPPTPMVQQILTDIGIPLPEKLIALAK
ncbi:hypothetical protein [Desulfitobacterium sp.]|uniref:hypothetical protein n=1 Tax=Desulfitobacterium sp. TaxID=49981 RepID=UPI002D7E223C|nr:hypothetical protein [Desulfitobacterium sp.]